MRLRHRLPLCCCRHAEYLRLGKGLPPSADKERIIARIGILLTGLAVIALALIAPPSLPLTGEASAGAYAKSTDAQKRKCERRCCRHKRKCKRRKRRLPPRPFAKSSIWNRPLPADIEISPISRLQIFHLSSIRRRYGAWINTWEWSTPVYRVRKRTRKVRVTIDQPPGRDNGLQAATAAVPIPRRAKPSVDNDGHLVVWQRSTDRMWEFFEARKAPDGWHASYGGAINGVSQDPGYFPRPPGWGATASGLPLIGGLISIRELRAGRIPHALSMAMPETRAGVSAWPAHRTDGSSYHPLALPLGTRLRIAPSLDLSKLNMPPFTRMLAEAAQRYGIFVTESGGAVAFYAEDPGPTGSNPYWPSPKGFFGGQSPGQLLESFPWSRLQVIQAPLTAR